MDPAPRLLEVGREQAATRGLEVEFVEGEAARLPLDDGAADVVLSVFGVIFAPGAGAAAGEMARVTAPAGRIALSAWIPVGAISQSVGVAREAITKALGAPPRPAPFAWHEREALAGLLGRHGFEVAVREERIAFTAASARDHFEAEFENHPLWIAGRAVLEPRGGVEAVRERTLEILEAANEDPDAFRVTSRYVVATARRA